MKPLLSLLMVLLSIIPVFGQGLIFHGGVRNSVYSYESTDQHTRMYQYSNLSMETRDQKIKFYTSFRYLTDFNQTVTNNKRFLAYDLNVRFKNLFTTGLNVNAGRQFIHPGTPVGALDGVKADYTFAGHYMVTAYGGYQSNYLRNFDIENSNAIAGGVFQVSNYLHSRIQALFVQKNNYDTVIWQLAGINTYSSMGKALVKLQAHYDLKNSQIHRLLLNGRYQISEKIRANIEFKQQQPQIYSNSFYTIFEIDPYTQYRAGLGYNIIRNCYIQGQFQHISFDGESADRFFLYLNNENGSIGLNYDTGFAGDQLSIMFDYAVELYQKFVLSAMIDYSHYRTEEIYEYENQMGNGLRLNYRINKHLSFDVEYQWLNSRYKKSDNRFLNHILYRW